MLLLGTLDGYLCQEKPRWYVGQLQEKTNQFLGFSPSSFYLFILFWKIRLALFFSSNMDYGLSTKFKRSCGWIQSGDGEKRIDFTGENWASASKTRDEKSKCWSWPFLLKIKSSPFLFPWFLFISLSLELFLLCFDSFQKIYILFHRNDPKMRNTWTWCLTNQIIFLRRCRFLSNKSFCHDSFLYWVFFPSSLYADTQLPTSHWPGRHVVQKALKNMGRR